MGIHMDMCVEHLLQTFDTDRLVYDFKNGMDIWCGSNASAVMVARLLYACGVEPVYWSDAKILVEGGQVLAQYLGVSYHEKTSREQGLRMYGVYDASSPGPRKPRPSKQGREFITLDDVIKRYSYNGRAEDDIETNGTMDFL